MAGKQFKSMDIWELLAHRAEIDALIAKKRKAMVRLTDPMVPTEVTVHDVQVLPVHDAGVETAVSVNVPRSTV